MLACWLVCCAVALLACFLEGSHEENQRQSKEQSLQPARSAEEHDSAYDELLRLRKKTQLHQTYSHCSSAEGVEHPQRFGIEPVQASEPLVRLLFMASSWTNGCPSCFGCHVDVSCRLLEDSSNILERCWGPGPLTCRPPEDYCRIPQGDLRKSLRNLHYADTLIISGGSVENK